MKIKVTTVPGKNVPESNVHTKAGSPVRVLHEVPDFKSGKTIHKQMRVEIWSEFTGWKRQTVLKSSLVYS